MKKILISMIAAVTVFTSCEKDSTATLGEGSLAFTPVIEKNINKVGKSVDRGSIPVYVKDITINTYNSVRNTSSLFEFNNNTFEEPVFFIADLPVGLTTIEASSNPAGTPEFAWVTKESAQNALPYVKYSSTEQLEVILEKGVTKDVSMNMVTNNGRARISFEADPSIFSNGTKDVKVVATSFASGAPLEKTMVFNADKLESTLYWSDDFSIEGKEIGFQIIWTNNNDLVQVATKQFVVEIEGGVSKNGFVTIGNGDYNISTVDAMFVFTPVEEVKTPVIIYDKDQELSMESIIARDWNLNNPTENGFIATSADKNGNFYDFKWTRSGEIGFANLGAAVYNSSSWNADIKQAAFNEVVNKDLPSQIRGWDLLVYDVHNNSNVADAYKSVYFVDGVLKADKIRKGLEYYDSYGVVIGLYRAHKAGFITDAEYNGSIEVVKDVVAAAGGATNEWEHAYYKLMEDETGEHITDYASTVNFDQLSGQSLGFALRAYQPELTAAQIITAVKDLNTQEVSLSSADLIEGLYLVL